MVRVSCVRSHRGFSSKVQSLLKQLERTEEGERGLVEVEKRGKEKYEQRNWKQLSERELSKLGTVARSRYQAVS